MPNAQVLEAKKATVSALAEQMKGATAGVFVDYKGITVEQDTKLRNEFREAGVNYTVVKNTLTRLAARDCGYDFDELLNGTTASSPSRTKFSPSREDLWRARSFPWTSSTPLVS